MTLPFTDTTNIIEVFGCDGQDSWRVGTMPVRMFDAHGIWLDDDQEILFCGGGQCLEDHDPSDLTHCPDVSYCHRWNPATNTYKLFDSNMTEPRYNFLFENILNPSDMQMYPVTVGSTKWAEIYDNTDNSWVQYQEFPKATWATDDCLTYYQVIYA